MGPCADGVRAHLHTIILNMKANFFCTAICLSLPALLSLNLCAEYSVSAGNTSVEATADTAQQVVKDSVRTNDDEPKENYREVSYPTPNFNPDKTNEVKGVILHHTAEPTIERSLGVLTSRTKGVGTHCVIDTDGTRYIMCEPTVVTFHAGFSRLDGREGCNNFTIGIEFQGNTLEKPLTNDQIKSAIEYLRPIIAKYDIPLKHVVSHEMVRKDYMKHHPQKRISGKVDITPTEYRRFMKELYKAYGKTFE